MADFGRFRITNGGIDLEYKAQATGTMNFTKFVLGDGEYSGAIKELTNVVSPVMNAQITRLNVQTAATNKKVTIGFNINTSSITTGFYLREIGLFAEDPDTHQDVLVFYGNAGETADYISSSSSTTISEKLIDLNVYIDDVENITAVIDSSMVYTSKAEFDTFKNTTNEALSGKVDKVEGKGLSTNDYDDTEKGLVATIPNKANITDINTLKTNLAPKSFTIPTTSWTQENGVYVATITDNTVTANDMVDVAIDKTTYTVATDAGVKGYVTEVAGTIKLYADSVPTGVISGKYTVAKVVAS